MEQKPCTPKEIHLNVNYNDPTQFKGRSVENGLPVTKPLYYLEELLAWRADDPRDKGQSFSIASVSYLGKEIAGGSPKTLVCHDMAGGYLADRFVQGTLCEDDEWYYMAYWDVVDTFVYFSHHFVTIPPVGWINCAHTNGVSVLGTFITEGDSGFNKCEAIFSSESVWKWVANTLVGIAKYYKFEGWLLHIGNDVEPKNMDRLKNFVQYLTEEMHRAVAGSQVIWYDSVTVEGVLSSQNELNVENQPFFDRCDGIFLNYTWDEIGLQRSAELAMAASRVSDVYVGVDVFGRGCYGGGGMNSAVAVEVSRRYSLSVAIFAPGWVKEVLGSKDFEINQSKFWKALAPHCKSRAVYIRHCEFHTNFHPGIEARGDLRYLHLSRQSLLPQMSSAALLPVPVKSQPHEVVLSTCEKQVFFKVRVMDAETGSSLIGYVVVKDPRNTSVNVTLKHAYQETCNNPIHHPQSDRVGWYFYPPDYSLGDFLCTTRNNKVEIQEFGVSAGLCPESGEIDICLDNVTWAKMEDCADLLFSSTICLVGIDESLPVIVSFRCGEESEFKQLGISYGDKYRIHNLHLLNPVHHGPNTKFVIKVVQRRLAPQLELGIMHHGNGCRLNFSNCKYSELVVTYGVKTTSPMHADSVSRCL